MELTHQTEAVLGLIDSGSESNLISREYANKCGLTRLHTNIGLETIDHQPITTHGMGLVQFSVTDQVGQQRFFEETFLIADVPNAMVLGMPFLKLANPSIDWLAGTLDWREFNVQTAMMTTQRVELIEPETSIEEALQQNTQAYVVHATAFSVDNIHPSRRTRIATTKAQETKVPEAYREFTDVFSDENAAELPEHGPHDHAIDLVEGKQPPYGPIYSLSETELTVLRAYLDTHLANGFIRPSTSPAGAPILFVPKANGTLRLCVDYRGLNNLTIKNRYPLPLVGESLDRLGRAKQYTQLDLTAAYNRIRIKEGDEWKSAFRTRYGHFEYCVMPFGLSNAPASFQSYINKALAPKLDIFCIVYLDDILIYTEERGKVHEDAVRWVLEQLRKHGLYCNLQKCRFSTEEVEFLGYVISPKGVYMKKDRIHAVQNWPRPRCIRDVQVFIGFANFYRRFIRGFSRIAGPLTAMLKTGTKVPNHRLKQPKGVISDFLTEEALEAFRSLKKAFIEAPVLRHYDADRAVRVETDASGYAIGGILAQQDDEGQWHPVAYFSRKMLPAERNYETHDAELLAIVEAFKTWRHYLEGSSHEVLVLTDHNNLTKFMETKRLSGRQIRWAQELSRYNFRIDYRQGKKNPADGLSRPPTADDDDDELRIENRKTLHLLQTSLADKNVSVLVARSRAMSEDVLDDTSSRERLHYGDMWKIIVCGTVSVPRVKAFWSSVRNSLAQRESPYTQPASRGVLERLSELQQEDEVAITVRKRLATLKDIEVSGTPEGASSSEPWSDSDHCLFYEDKAYIPASLRGEILEMNHDDPLAGHFGKDKSIELISRKYYWPSMKKDIASYVEGCDVCMSSKAARHKPYGNLQSLPIPTHKWKDLTMDFVTGLPKSKDWREVEYDSILVIIDRLTKMVHYEPVVKTLTAEQLAEVLMESVFKYHGLPDSIVTDRGSLFTSHFWSSLCYYMKVKRRLSTAFHPQTDGQTERQNSTMEAYLRSYCRFEQDDWVQWLATAEFAYNNTQHSSTKMTPFEANIGYHPRMSYEDNRDPRSKSKAAEAQAEDLRDLLVELRNNLLKAQENQAKYHNKTVKERCYAPGEKVWLNSRHIKTKRNKKLEHKFLGPFEVLRPIGTQAYELKLPKSWKIHPVFHVSLLERDTTRREVVDEQMAKQLEFESDDMEEYEVESIRDSAVYTDIAEDGRPAGLYYLIHWKGYPDAEDTWEPLAGVKHLRKLLKKFHEENPTKPTARSTPQATKAPSSTKEAGPRTKRTKRNPITAMPKRSGRQRGRGQGRGR